MRALALALALASLPGAPAECRRRVYVDLGANWANTLRLHDKLQNHVRHATMKPPDPLRFDNCSYSWEVYAFEASPVMHPFVDRFVAYLNGIAQKPVLTVPPVGGSIQMLAYAKAFGCSYRHNKTEYPLMYSCMYNIFRDAYNALRVDPALNDTALVRRRLDEAATPNRGHETRYTFVPAAVGAADGVLDMEWPAGVLLYINEPLEPVPRPDGVPAAMRVQVVDWVQWLTSHFRHDDIVLVKMDVEGAEHPILNRMMRERSIDLVDVLGLECHRTSSSKHQCATLQGQLSQHGVRLVSEASYSPSSTGVDPYSHPKDFMPVDPRSRGFSAPPATSTIRAHGG